jgi:hypothetical protein
MEVSVPADNPLQLLLDEIEALGRIEPPVRTPLIEINALSL